MIFSVDLRYIQWRNKTTVTKFNLSIWNYNDFYFGILLYLEPVIRRIIILLGKIGNFLVLFITSLFD